MRRIEPKNCSPSGWIPGLTKVAWLQVSIAEKAAEATIDEDDRRHPGDDRPHLDQPAIGRRHQQGDRIAGGGQQGDVDDEAQAEIVGDSRQGAKEEIAGPSRRLQDPEGAVLVLEERLLLEPEWLPALRRLVAGRALLPGLR